MGVARETGISCLSIIILPGPYVGSSRSIHDPSGFYGRTRASTLERKNSHITCALHQHQALLVNSALPQETETS